MKNLRLFFIYMYEIILKILEYQKAIKEKCINLQNKYELRIFLIALITSIFYILIISIFSLISPSNSKVITILSSINSIISFICILLYLTILWFEIYPKDIQTKLSKDQINISGNTNFYSMGNKKTSNSVDDKYLNATWKPTLKFIKNKKELNSKKDIKSNNYVNLYNQLIDKINTSDSSNLYYMPTNVSLSDYHYAYYNIGFFNNYIKSNIYKYIRNVYTTKDTITFFENNENIIANEDRLDRAYKSFYFYFQKQVNKLILDIKCYTRNRSFYNNYKPNKDEFHEVIAKHFLTNSKIIDTNSYWIEFKLDNGHTVLIQTYFKEVLIDLLDKNSINKNEILLEINSFKKILLKNSQLDLDWYIKELTNIVTLNNLSNDATPKRITFKENKTFKKNNFNINIPENQIQKLYNLLVKYDLLNLQKTQLTDFQNVFYKNWDDHNSKIYFKIDNPSIREFFELLKETFANKELRLVDFIKNSDLIRKDNGEHYSYNAVKNSKFRTLESKKNKELSDIFKSFTL